MRTLVEIGEAIKNVFLQFEWTFVLEVILFYLLVYLVCKTLHENNAKKLIALYLGIILAVGVCALFSASPYAGLYYLVVVLLTSAVFLLLFSMEIKRSVWNISRTPQASAEKHVPKTQMSMRAEECITGIVKAVQNLSKNEVGALIVLSNGNLPKEIVESGVALDSNISSQLIEGVFIPKAPLHDGAMIIYGDKIQAAGCFLPLTQKETPKEFGTRHRAGIGITEAADVTTIIVSEETGIVSYVKRGVITRYVDSDGLRKLLRDYYWKEFPTGGKKA
ncbi:MAG: diadenylate cyclase [Clostridia bacterium]|nr:diadenylate cyclase [Clostridia bacterium]